ncbi:MAG TPA: hypothetical protein VGW36_09420 [Pyrinomonadaceae bacterium]|nr:hypothetical protein [Pyrinomonadaceae bacterium]
MREFTKNELLGNGPDVFTADVTELINDFEEMPGRLSEYELDRQEVQMETRSVLHCAEI